MRESIKRAMLYIGPSSLFASAVMRIVTHYCQIPKFLTGDLYLVMYVLFNIVLIMVYPHDFEMVLEGRQEE
jgi:hypothetical protein